VTEIFRVYDFFKYYLGYILFLQENNNNMENITINLNDNQVIIKRYKIRPVGNQNATIETTIPKEAFEREARRNGMTTQEALTNLIAVWRFDGFQGLHLSFEKVQG
jgi:hypothetical protein